MRLLNIVEGQLNANPHILDRGSEILPDYSEVVEKATAASLREAVPGCLLCILMPLLTGAIFGVRALLALLVGTILSGTQLAIMMSNAGSALDNAKKLCETFSEMTAGREACVVGDTVGDPLKDACGSALNVLMKLQAVLSLVFLDALFAISHGKGLAFHV